MKDDQSQDDINKRLNILDHIEKYGCHLILIEADNDMPAFVYSIGLFERFGHPEIICFGLKTEVMATAINHACDLIHRGEKLQDNTLYPGFLEGYNIQFLWVDQDYYPNYVGYAGWFYDNSFHFPLLQLVWPDKQHLFPWEEHFNPDWKYKQPLLDRNTDFKFYEQRSLGVYTSRHAFDGESILYVYHDLDGDWQFHTRPETDAADAIIVCLEEITRLDPTINELYHLPFGWWAWRDNKEAQWEYEEYTHAE